MKPISFIQPSRNNLKYLKWSYNSIRKNLGYIHEICMADDFSNDGTWEWMQEIEKKDRKLFYGISRDFGVCEGFKKIINKNKLDRLLIKYFGKDYSFVQRTDPIMLFNKRNLERMQTTTDEIIKYIINLGYKLTKQLGDNYVFLPKEKFKNLL